MAETVGVTITTVGNWRDKYKEIGLRCLHDAPRSGRPIEVTGEQRAKVTALACSAAPAGHSQWGLRMLANKAVELGYCEHISHTHVSTILKKRTQTSSEENLVHQHNRCTLSGADGASAGPVCSALRAAVSGGML